MKVYVDSEIERCLDCPCHNGESGYCQITGKYVCEYIPKSCPLQSLADYTKQVRKEVVQEIKKWCDKNFNWVGDGVGYDGQDYNEMIGSNNTINKLRKFLDKIGEEEC